MIKKGESWWKSIGFLNVLQLVILSPFLFPLKKKRLTKKEWNSKTGFKQVFFSDPFDFYRKVFIFICIEEREKNRIIGIIIKKFNKK